MTNINPFSNNGLDFLKIYTYFGKRICIHCNLRAGTHNYKGICSNSNDEWFTPNTLLLNIGDKIRASVRSPIDNGFVPVNALIKNLNPLFVTYHDDGFLIDHYAHGGSNIGFVYDLLEKKYLEDWYTIIASRKNKKVVILIKDENKNWLSLSNNIDGIKRKFEIDFILTWHTTAPVQGWTNMYETNPHAKSELKTNQFNIALENAEIYLLIGGSCSDLIRVSIDSSRWRT